MITSYWSLQKNKYDQANYYLLDDVRFKSLNSKLQNNHIFARWPMSAHIVVCEYMFYFCDNTFLVHYYFLGYKMLIVILTGTKDKVQSRMQRRQEKVMLAISSISCPCATF